MRKFLLLFFLFLTTVSLQASELQGRKVIDFDFGWKFHLGEINIKDLSNIDVTSDWRVVDIPHDFQIEEPWTAPDKNETSDNSDQASNFKSRLSARGFKEMSSGWYVKTFNPADSLKGKRIIIDFQGIMYVGDVYLNGERIGGTDYGYVGFEIDMSKKLKYGQENIIAVRANTSTPTSSRWYTGGGLFRDVNIYVTDSKQYFTRHPLYITTKDNREVNIQVEVANYTKDDQVTMLTRIIDATGNEVYSNKNSEKFNRKMRTNEIALSPIVIEDAHLWNCEDPYLYTAEVTLYNSKGDIIDQTSSRFGIRTIEISPEFGLKVNGKKILLKGIANHHTLGALGAATYKRAMEKRLKMLKDFGFNHVRTSHNPYSESFLDLCDELGILVVDELYDKWLDQFSGGRKPWMQLWPYDLPEWIKRDRNHPSVIVWSLGNELQTYASLPFGDWGVTPFRMMKPVLKRYDSTRPVTVAMHPRGRSLETDSVPAPLVFETDIAAYNYRYMYFPGDHRRWPNMVFYQSEANTSMMGPNFYEMNRDQVLGLAYWGMIDYLGESRGWPLKGWQDGVFDISLQPKPMAYLLKSMFIPDEPTIHIGVVDSKADKTEWNGIIFSNDGMSENWNRTEGNKYTVNVYTNCEKVELLLNGKKIAEKDNTTNPKQRDKIRFNDIEYHPGVLEAVGYKDGKIAARHKIETSGKASKLMLTADQQEWMADGKDLMHVRVISVDNKGRRDWKNYTKLKFEVEGDAKVVAVDNGDMNSNELHATSERSLYQGSALVILRAGKNAGKVNLKVIGDGFKTQTLKLQTK